MAGSWPFLIIGQRIKIDLIFPNANELTLDDVNDEFKLEKGKPPVKLHREDASGYLERVTKKITAVYCINDESYYFNNRPYVGVRLNCDPYELRGGLETLDINRMFKHQAAIKKRIAEVKACMAELGLPNKDVGLYICIEHDL